MKFLDKFFVTVILLFSFACSSSEEIFVPMEKISDQGKMWNNLMHKEEFKQKYSCTNVIWICDFNIKSIDDF